MSVVVDGLLAPSANSVWSMIGKILKTIRKPKTVAESTPNVRIFLALLMEDFSLKERKELYMHKQNLPKLLRTTCRISLLYHKTRGLCTFVHYFLRLKFSKSRPVLELFLSGGRKGFFERC